MNFKRLLKPILVILAILILTLSVSAGDLYSTYGQRIKLTIDHTEIDSDLAWFPVTVFLTSSQGTEVFTEFDADDDFDRIAFTSSDGETQLYADCELFDDSEQKAIYHVSKTGWTVSSSADQDFYLYYDNTAGHNTTYISKSGDTAAQSVWDSNFKAVYHMADNTTSTIVDATSNANHGTKKGSGEPIEATGKVGQGQDFDGTDDYIEIPTFGIFDGSSDYTIEFLYYQHTGGRQLLLCLYGENKLQIQTGEKQSDNVLHLRGEIGGIWEDIVVASTHSYNTWYLGSVTYNTTSGYVLYRDAGSEDTDASTGTIGTRTEYNNVLGFNPKETDFYYDGLIDEVRISSTARSAAWIAATYSTLYDTLLTYGSEETAPTGEVTNVLFIFSNF